MLKFVLLLISAVAITTPRTEAQSAGCVEGLNSQPVACAFQTCSGKAIVTVPYGGFNDSLYVVCGSVLCCGVQVGITYVQRGWCQMAELKDPRIGGRLIELAKSQSLLISNCKGDLIRVEAAVNTEQEPLINLRRPRSWNDLRQSIVK